jgi:hypothetical protein
LKGLKTVPPPGDEFRQRIVEEEAARVLSSPGFVSSPRLARLFRFPIDQTLADRKESIKESIIAIEVFDRGIDFDPQLDSMVRVQVGRLRSRLTEYYAKADSRVRIEIPKGNYIPNFIFPAGDDSVPVAPPSTHRMVLLAGILFRESIDDQDLSNAGRIAVSKS